MKYVLGNWKMTPTVPESVALAGRIDDTIRGSFGEGELPEVIIAPPFTSLTAVHDVLDEHTLELAAQDCHWEDHGSFTGNVSARMLQGLVHYCLVGHGDRRRAGEKDADIARKLAAIVRHDLIPILYVGEEDANEIATTTVEEQLRAALEDVAVADLKELLVVYEPGWAGVVPADAEHIGEVTQHIHAVLAELSVPGKVLYAGSVNPETVSQILDASGLDGVSVGRASLDEKQFSLIVTAVAKS